MPDVSIIIRTKNQREFLGQSLPVIWQQETNYTFEVILVDSGSPAEVLDWIRTIFQNRPAKLLHIRPEDFGFSYSLNMGIKESRGKYVICLSGDAIPADSHWLENIIQPLEGPSIAGVYGRQIPRNRANLVERIKLSIRYSKSLRVQKKSHIFSNASCAFKRELATQYPFDETLPVCEDYDWARRIQRAGFAIVYQPQAIVYHSHSTGTIEQIRRIFNFWWWRFKIDHFRG